MSAISFRTGRNRAARSPCLTTVSSLGHVQILTRTSLDRRLTFIVHRSILLVSSLWLSWPLTSVIHTTRRPSDTSPSGHAARNTRTTDHSWRGRSKQEHPRELSAPGPDFVAGRFGHHAADSGTRLGVVKALASLDPRSGLTALTTPRTSARMALT